MSNTISEDFAKIHELESKLSKLSDQNEREEIIDKLIIITDNYSMESNQDSSRQVIRGDIHTIATTRQQHLFNKMEILGDRLTHYVNTDAITDAKEIQKQLLETDKLWKVALEKCLET